MLTSEDVLFSAEVADQCQYKKEKPNQNGGESYDLGEIHPPIHRLVPNHCLQLTLSGQAPILQRALLLKLLVRLFAREDHHVHRETVGAQMRIDEMNGEDKQDGQQRFLT